MSPPEREHAGRDSPDGPGSAGPSSPRCRLTGHYEDDGRIPGAPGRAPPHAAGRGRVRRPPARGAQPRGGRARRADPATTAAGRRRDDGGGPHPRRGVGPHRGHRELARGRPVRRAGRAGRRTGTSAADVHPSRHRPGQGDGDRRLADRARAAGAAHRRAAADPAPRHRGSPRVVRLPGAPPADELVPRGAGADPRPDLRKPVPDREVRWRRLHRRGREHRHRPGRGSRGRDRERPPLRGGGPA